MNMKANRAEIKPGNISREFLYNYIVMLSVEITYPQLKTSRNTPQYNKINRVYRSEAKKFYKYTLDTLFTGAIENYIYSSKNNFPFHAFDAVMNYEVTLNDNCHLSTYFDRYEYTGGAHGSTIRTSNSFDLKTGYQLQLKDLFKNNNYRKLILDKVLIMAEVNYNNDPYLYFENYKDLIVENFNEDNFNLTKDGIIIYYQQYDIAPYAAGIISFEIPYNVLGIKAPNCF